MTNTLRIMLEILSNYPWTRLSVRIIGAIKKQFFHMVTHVFGNRNLSQEIFAIDTWGAVICSLGHAASIQCTGTQKKIFISTEDIIVLSIK